MTINQCLLEHSHTRCCVHCPWCLFSTAGARGCDKAAGHAKPNACTVWPSEDKSADPSLCLTVQVRKLKPRDRPRDLGKSSRTRLIVLLCKILTLNSCSAETKTTHSVTVSSITLVLQMGFLLPLPQWLPNEPVTDPRIGVQSLAFLPKAALPKPPLHPHTPSEWPVSSRSFEMLQHFDAIRLPIQIWQGYQ